MPPTKRIRYEPDYGTKPGEVLEEYLAAAGMTKAELAARCGRPMKTISEIIHGKAAITPETALQLERVLGRPASLWQNLEANYRLHLAEVGEREDLANHGAWANRFPVRELVSRGDIEQAHGTTDLVRKLLKFFGVGTVAGWDASFGSLRVAYRRSPAFKQAPESVMAWLRLGEIEADGTNCAPFDRAKFKSALGEVRLLASKSFPDVHKRVVELCAAAGVVVVFVPELPKTHLSGVARWLSKDKALIQLSLRHKTSDHAWFSFFHEAGHILLHGKKTIFIDEQGGDRNEIESEADRFARDWLLEPSAFRRFAETGDFCEAAIKRFATQQGVAPGIVVGRLQHDKLIKFSEHNGLKERLAWA
ncbi:MAG: HigA family addiction module antitoxin [Polyangiaceae bacterium]|jgi:addiction module HigA family antidote